MSFEKAFTLFINTCELKFIYWFEKNILPVYLTQGSDGVTKALVSKTFENFETDVKACINPQIYKSLMNNYFSDRRALDIYLKEYFHNKINAYEIKNSKNIFNANQILKTIEKGS